jgi:hypothetical protein
MSVAVRLRVVRSPREVFFCEPRGEAVTVGRCVGRQVAVLANGADEHPACAACATGRQIAREAGVSFGDPAARVPS